MSKVLLTGKTNVTEIGLTLAGGSGFIAAHVLDVLIQHGSAPRRVELRS
jgi:hypothetical protein